jgi:hypothetical protein
MADQQKPPKQWTRPGVVGGIQDAVEAVAKAFGPKSITQRRAKINQAIDDADPPSQKLGDQF